MRTLARYFLPLALIVLLVTPTAAKDVPAGEDVTMADAEKVLQRNLQVFMGGKQAGGVSFRVGKMKDGSVLMEYRFVMEMTRGNGGEADKFRVESFSLEYVGPDGKTRWTQAREEEAGVVTTIKAVYGDTHVVVDFNGPGARFKRELLLPKNHMTDYQAFKALVPRFEKGEDAHMAYVSLDAEEVTFEPNETTILGRKSIQHNGKSYDGYEVKAVSPSGPATLIVDAEFLPMHVSMMGIIEAKWTDGSPFEFSAGGWEISSFIPVEGYVPMAPHVDRMDVTLSFKTPIQSEKPLFSDNAYMQAKEVDGAWKLTLRSTRLRDDEKAPSRPVAVSEPALKRFLEPTPLSQSDHPSIVAKAKEIVGEAKSALKATQKIVLWVYANLEKRGGKRGNATAVEVLKDGLGDCSEHAALTVALCRAAGIPARNASGIVYVSTRDGQALGGYHAWSEVWLGRWVAVDATIPEVGTSARYILFEYDEPGETAGRDLMPRLIGAGPSLKAEAYTPLGGTRTEVKR